MHLGLRVGRRPVGRAEEEQHMAPGDGRSRTREKVVIDGREASAGHPLHPLVQSLSLNRLRPYGQYAKHGGRRSQVTWLVFPQKSC